MSAPGNPFKAIGDGLHSKSRGVLAEHISSHRAVSNFAAMSEIDATHKTRLAEHAHHLNSALETHKSALSRMAARDDHGMAREAAREDHGYTLDRIGFQTQADIAKTRAAGKQERKTAVVKGQQERDSAVVSAHAKVAEIHQSGLADVSRINAKSAATVGEVRERGSQERRTYGFKARTDASLAPQPHVAANPLPQPSDAAPAAPKPAARSTKPVQRAQPHDTEAPTRLTTRTLQSKMKPVTPKGRKRPPAPGVTFSG